MPFIQMESTRHDELVIPSRAPRRQRAALPHPERPVRRAASGKPYNICIAKACPHIKATAVDLPRVAPIAQQGATDRVQVLATDVISGPLPGAYDAAILRALLQVFSPADTRLAVKNVGAAVKSSGKIYIVGQILDNSHTAPLEAVGFSLTFINLLEEGESHTEVPRLV